MDRMDFIETNNQLKSMGLYFNKEEKAYLISEKNIDEKLILFEKNKMKVEITELAGKRIGELPWELYKGSTKFFRGIKIKEELLDSKYKLKEYQKQIIKYQLERTNALNRLKPGRGKSLINIMVFSQLYTENKIDGIILLVPNSLEYQWKKEILKFVSIFKEDEIIIINKEHDNRLKPFENYKEAKIIITPYHVFKKTIMSYRKDYTPQLSGKKIKWDKTFVDIKKEWNKKSLCLVADECHMLKNSDSIQSKAVESISSQCDFKYLSSATPFLNHFTHSYSLFNILDKSIIGKSENAFILEVGKQFSKFNKFMVEKYNENRVQEYLEKYKILMTPDVDESEFKTKIIEKPIYLELGTLQREIYREVCLEELKKLEKNNEELTYRLVLNKMWEINRALSNPFLLKDIENESIQKLLKKWDLKHDVKFQALKSRIEDIIDEKNEKIIVYGISPETLNMLHEEFKEYKPLIIHGKLGRINRHEIIEKFNTDPKHKLIILSALTSSSGINLNEGGNYILVYELPSDSTHYFQLKSRTDRASSTKDSIVETLIIDKTIEVGNFERTVRRMDLNNKLDKEIPLHELKRLLNGEEFEIF